MRRGGTLALLKTSGCGQPVRSQVFQPASRLRARIQPSGVRQPLRQNSGALVPDAFSTRAVARRKHFRLRRRELAQAFLARRLVSVLPLRSRLGGRSHGWNLVGAISGVGTMVRPLDCQLLCGHQAPTSFRMSADSSSNHHRLAAGRGRSAHAVADARKFAGDITHSTFSPGRPLTRGNAQTHGSFSGR